MNFKEQLLQALSEDTAFREEVAFLLADDLTDALILDTSHSYVTVTRNECEHEVEVITEVSLMSNNLPSDEDRLAKLRYEKNRLISSGYEKLWRKIKTKNRVRREETRGIYTDLVDSKIVEGKPINYIKSIVDIIENIQDNVLSNIDKAEALPDFLLKIK